LKYFKKNGGDEQPIIEIFQKNGGDEQPIIENFKHFEEMSDLLHKIHLKYFLSDPFLPELNSIVCRAIPEIKLNLKRKK